MKPQCCRRNCSRSWSDIVHRSWPRAQHLAAVGPQQAGQDGQQRRLAAAGRPHEQGDLAAVQLRARRRSGRPSSASRLRRRLRTQVVWPCRVGVIVRASTVSSHRSPAPTAHRRLSATASPAPPARSDRRANSPDSMAITSVTPPPPTQQLPAAAGTVHAEAVGHARPGRRPPAGPRQHADDADPERLGQHHHRHPPARNAQRPQHGVLAQRRRRRRVSVWLVTTAPTSRPSSAA